MSDVDFHRKKGHKNISSVNIHHCSSSTSRDVLISRNLMNENLNFLTTSRRSIKDKITLHWFKPCSCRIVLYCVLDMRNKTLLEQRYHHANCQENTGNSRVVYSCGHSRNNCMAIFIVLFQFSNSL
jgi:hypothetical protein